jgi:hypothetical protein
MSNFELRTRVKSICEEWRRHIPSKTAMEESKQEDHDT